MKSRKLKKLKAAIRVRRRVGAKEREAQSKFARAKADFFSTINEINNDLGTNYSHEDLFR